MYSMQKIMATYFSKNGVVFEKKFLLANALLESHAVWTAIQNI
jgi:hypothetical protein